MGAAAVVVVVVVVVTPVVVVGNTVGSTAQICSVTGGSANCCADATGPAVAVSATANPSVNAKRRMSTDLSLPTEYQGCGHDTNDYHGDQCPDP